MRNTAAVVRLLSLIIGVFGAALASAGEIAIKDGQKIAFLGDSITQGGWSDPVGYVRLVVAGLATNGITVTPIPAGVSGHKSNEMLERLRRDVLDKKPDWMTLSCGVNDVWHGETGVPLDLYKNNLAAIVDSAQEAGVKVMILTSTPIGENLGNANNQKLAAYNDFLRKKGREKDCLLADLSADFHAKLKDQPADSKTNMLTIDGVHMNAVGNKVMASGILRAFGLDDVQLKKAEESWKDIPGGARMAFGYGDKEGKALRGNLNLSLREHDTLEALASKQGKKIDQMLQAIFAEETRKFLKPAGDFESVQAIFDAGKETEIHAELQKKFSERVRELLKEQRGFQKD